MILVRINMALAIKQRIENFWSHYKRGYSSWIIGFFKDLMDSIQFHLGNYVHMESAWFSFAPLMQSELAILAGENLCFTEFSTKFH